MCDDKNNTAVCAANGGIIAGGEGVKKNGNGNRYGPGGDKNVLPPPPRTPAEMLWQLTHCVQMFQDVKGLSTLGKDKLQAAEDLLTTAQGVIRKAISEIKRREEGELQLRFAVRNAFYGVANTSGEDSEVIIAAAKTVALSVAKQLNLPDPEKYTVMLENEYRGRKMPTAFQGSNPETIKYRVTVDGKVVSEKCRRNNLELARILHKYGITDGEKSEDCKAAGIDITAVNNLNEPVEYVVRKRHLKIERIQ